jgi:hypothetical protein
LESVVSAHEIIHDVAHSDQIGFIFKLDYDKCDKEFLLRKFCWSAIGDALVIVYPTYYVLLLIMPRYFAWNFIKLPRSSSMDTWVIRYDLYF